MSWRTFTLGFFFFTKVKIFFSFFHKKVESQNICFSRKRLKVKICVFFQKRLKVKIIFSFDWWVRDIFSQWLRAFLKPDRAEDLKCFDGIIMKVMKLHQRWWNYNEDDDYAWWDGVRLCSIINVKTMQAQLLHKYIWIFLLN